MMDREMLKDYFSRIMEVVNQMKTYGESIPNQRIDEKILISLSEKYNPIVAVIENMNDLTTLSVEELMGSIKSFEERLNRQSEKSIESAFQSKLDVDASKTHGKEASSYDRFRGQNSRGGWNGRGRDTNVRGKGRNNFQEREMMIPLNKGVEFIIEVAMLIKIVGSRENSNVTIATNFSI